MLEAKVLLILAAALSQGGELRDDARELPSSRSAAYVAAGLLAGGVCFVAGDPGEKLEGAPVLEETARLTNVYGGSSFNLPVSFGIWAVGRVTGARSFEEVGGGLTRVLTLTQLVVAPIKLATRRQRPDGSDRLSFPSGHTANAFAVARLIQCHYGGRWAAPLYLVGALTAAGRLEDSRHYLSDVLMGAAVGLAVGSSVGVGGDSSSRLAMLPAKAGAGLIVRLQTGW